MLIHSCSAFKMQMTAARKCLNKFSNVSGGLIIFNYTHNRHMENSDKFVFVMQKDCGGCDFWIKAD